MKTNEIKNIVKALSLEALTCNAIRSYYSGWVELYGKDDAKKIEKAAKEFVKSLAAQRAAQSASVKAYLCDGAKVAAAAWAALLKDKDYKDGAAFAKYLKGRGYNTPESIVRNFSKYITKDGRPCVRHIERDVEGAIVRTWYTERNTESVSGYLAALKAAVSFAKAEAVKGKAKASQTIVIAE